MEMAGRSVQKVKNPRGRGRGSLMCAQSWARGQERPRLSWLWSLRVLGICYICVATGCPPLPLDTDPIPLLPALLPAPESPPWVRSLGLLPTWEDPPGRSKESVMMRDCHTWG